MYLNGFQAPEQIRHYTLETYSILRINIKSLFYLIKTIIVYHCTYHIESFSKIFPTQLFTGWYPHIKLLIIKILESEQRLVIIYDDPMTFERIKNCVCRKMVIFRSSTSYKLYLTKNFRLKDKNLTVTPCHPFKTHYQEYKTLIFGLNEESVQSENIFF